MLQILGAVILCLAALAAIDARTARSWALVAAGGVVGGLLALLGH